MLIFRFKVKVVLKYKGRKADVYQTYIFIQVKQSVLYIYCVIFLDRKMIVSSSEEEEEEWTEFVPLFSGPLPYCPSLVRNQAAAAGPNVSTNTKGLVELPW